MKLRNLIIAAAAAALPAAVHAQPVTGGYIGAGVGINQLLDTNIKSGGKITADPGGVALLRGGYGFGNGVRVELEGNGRYNDGKVAGKSGWGEQYGLFGNVLYDFDIGSTAIYPYVGAGIGVQWARLEAAGVKKSSDAYIAGQVIGGAAFPIQSVPGLAVTAEARFTSSIDDVSFPGGKTDRLQNVSGLLGLRYAFGAAPAPAPMAPAPVATPAPAPARSYLVFFDWDKADLTARAKAIIAEAADSSKKVATTTIDVSGHADRTGTAAYNKALSMRRAQAVSAELVRLGVPQKEIAIFAYGDTKPLVPTGPGVREPQNRRVEIVLK